MRNNRKWSGQRVSSRSCRIRGCDSLHTWGTSHYFDTEHLFKLIVICVPWKLVSLYIKRATSCQASDVAVIGVPSDRQGEVKISLKPGTIIDILKPLTNTQSYLLLIHIFYFLTFSKVRLQLWSKQFSLIFRFHELMLCEAIKILLRIWWVIWCWHMQSDYYWLDSLFKFTINSLRIVCKCIRWGGCRCGG